MGPEMSWCFLRVLESQNAFHILSPRKWSQGNNMLCSMFQRHGEEWGGMSSLGSHAPGAPSHLGQHPEFLVRLAKPLKISPCSSFYYSLWLLSLSNIHNGHSFILSPFPAKPQAPWEPEVGFTQHWVQCKRVGNSRNTYGGKRENKAGPAVGVRFCCFAEKLG